MAVGFAMTVSSNFSPFLSGPITLSFGFFYFRVFRFWLCPPDPPVFGWGALFATFDRGSQTGPPRSNDFLFGAADDTGAADDRPPALRRPSTGRPTTVHSTNGPTVPSFSA